MRETTQFAGASHRSRKSARLKRSVAFASQKQEESGLPVNIEPNQTRIDAREEKRGTLLGIPVTFQAVYKVTQDETRRKQRARDQSTPSLPGPLFRSRSIIRHCTKEIDEIVTRRIVTHSRVTGEIH